MVLLQVGAVMVPVLHNRDFRDIIYSAAELTGSYNLDIVGMDELNGPLNDL